MFGLGKNDLHLIAVWVLVSVISGLLLVLIEKHYNINEGK